MLNKKSKLSENLVSFTKEASLENLSYSLYIDRRSDNQGRGLHLSGEGICALAMSSAQTGWQMDDESMLSFGHMTSWLHTANAVTVSEQSSRTFQHGSLRTIDVLAGKRAEGG